MAFAALLLAVFGLLHVGVGILLYGQGSELNQIVQRTSVNLMGVNLDRQTLRSILGVTPPVLILLGALEIVLGVGIFAHKGWARVLGIVVAVLGLLVAIVSVSISLALASGFSVLVVIAVVLLIGYAFILLALVAGGSHFRRRLAQR